jgi:glycosyltransferase involved in cell wall biosynthesis
MRGGGEGEFLDRGEARAALQLAPDGPVIGWVGRLIHAKGADVFLRALAELRDLPFQAALIGDGPERAALERLSEELGLTASVRFYGAIPDARRCFRAFDVFALSSRAEGTPIVLFEAITANVPLVGTAVGGVPDVLTPNTALLILPDDARNLATAISRVTKNAQEARSRASQARALLDQKYAIEPWLDRYQSVYTKTVHSGASNCVIKPEPTSPRVRS